MVITCILLTLIVLFIGLILLGMCTDIFDNLRPYQIIYVQATFFTLIISIMLTLLYCIWIEWDLVALSQ